MIIHSKDEYRAQREYNFEEQAMASWKIGAASLVEISTNLKGSDHLYPLGHSRNNIFTMLNVLVECSKLSNEKKHSRGTYFRFNLLFQPNLIKFSKCMLIIT